MTALSPIVAGRNETDPAFLGRRNERMTRFGIHRLVARYARSASKSQPSLSVKRVSPHIIRHTTAVHLLRSGVDINTIRAWLGHVSLDTTHVYAEVDMEMKATALASVDIKALPQTPAGTYRDDVADGLLERPIVWPQASYVATVAAESAPNQQVGSVRNINTAAT